MEEKKSNVSFEEFSVAWIKCVAAMDELTAEQGYNDLTMRIIGNKAGIPEEKMLEYFLTIDTLFQMYRMTLSVEKNVMDKIDAAKNIDL